MYEIVDFLGYYALGVLEIRSWPGKVVFVPHLHKSLEDFRTRKGKDAVGVR